MRKPDKERRRAGSWALGALMLAMAAGQLTDPAGFVDIIATYRLGGYALALVSAVSLVAGEAFAGAGLFSSDTAHRRRAATVALGVAVAWTALGLSAFVRGLDLDNCGCFGAYAAQPLRWWVMVEDVEFVALTVWVRRRAGRGPVRGSLLSGRADGTGDQRIVVQPEHGRPT